MNNAKMKLVVIALALVTCIGMLVGCNNGKSGNDGDTGTGSVAGTTVAPDTDDDGDVGVAGGTLDLPDIPMGTGTDGEFDIDAFYAEQYAQMTPEEIAQFEQDLKDLGITKEQLASLLFYNETAQTMTAAAE